MDLHIGAIASEEFREKFLKNIIYGMPSETGDYALQCRLTCGVPDGLSLFALHLREEMRSKRCFFALCRD